MVPELPRDSTAPKPSADEAGETMTAPAGNRYRLDLARFHCYRSLIKSLGPRDEIYWWYAAGADGKTSNEHRTRDGTALFEGRVVVDVAEHVEVWEADDSGGANYCINAAIEAAKLGNDPRDEYRSTNKAAAILALAAIAMGWLVRLIINDDDFVARRTVGWATAGLIRS
ncbi:uncharacterized protein Aud_002334 [Aspergillus udagawae]|uniref:Uncharacterized protein n=1 Tax=Aspergillus udagawae TaxID=91492 RepID=A0A8E0UY10_9EURO|nr:uncharacterized protein Aud_002334 [Aspergillus udagawae]GIC85975.1 hypothetical protein Aud_002334 [Aspergillus udagawae]